MRKLILTITLAVFSASVFSQSLEDIEKYLALQRWEDAKGLVDKFLTSEKNAKVAKGWYYKGYIYSQLANLPKYAGNTFRMDAFEAYKKYQELDPKNTLMKDNENVEFFALYNSYFDSAIVKYNAKKYADAFLSFKDAITIEDFIRSKNYSYKKYSFPAMDTQLIQNTALSAYLAKDSANAATYYQKLADAKIKAEGFLEIYQFLVEYFGVKKDVASRNKYIAIGKEVYPESDYWCALELQDAGTDKAKIFAKYDELLKGTCGTYIMHYNYAAELFNYLYTQDKKPADYLAIQAKLEDVLKKALAIKPAPEPNLLMARHLYNVVYDIQDAITAVKGNKPDDAKKKADLNAQLKKKFEEMLPYAMAAYDYFDGKATLKTGEKGNFKVVISLIQSYWESKNDAAKVKFYQDKSKSLE